VKHISNDELKKNSKSNVYFLASKERYNDFLKLNTSDDSIVYAVYSAGLSIECLLRAFIAKKSDVFDSRHDLKKLFIESKISQILSPKDRDKMTLAIQVAADSWNNAIRYESIKSLKRKLGHKIANKRIKRIEKSLRYNFSDFFDQTKKVHEIGEKYGYHR